MSIDISKLSDKELETLKKNLMKDNANQKAFDLHKQTSCPLDECVKALKMEEPIDYLKDKARMRGGNQK